ncbi:hypothetical protein [Amycolatopsis circi]|uniref:hypothetical protein n=1 Tax=Amycolatopsis circi TaxID=871959 RepID=UPI0013BEA44A|nr:hypothetical protein [Amycolatopsis circi]
MDDVVMTVLRTIVFPGVVPAAVSVIGPLWSPVISYVTSHVYWSRPAVPLYVNFGSTTTLQPAEPKQCLETVLRATSKSLAAGGAMVLSDVGSGADGFTVLESNMLFQVDDADVGSAESAPVDDPHAVRETNSADATIAKPMGL